MAVVKQYGTPNLFITMTCNPKWREILDNIPAGHQANDHPMLTSRVFQSKFDALLKDLLEGHIFGLHVANLAVIEFQKRGLPHTHILLTLRDEDKPVDPIRMDQLISAEIPDPVAEPELYDIVTKNMVHNPCGRLNPNAVCMVDGGCSKKFPKPFAPQTTVDENGRITYRRPDNGRTITVTRNGVEHTLDNRWIVPYNPYLLLKYNCHINVEACVNTGTVKYLYKYFFKGVDMALLRVRARFPEEVDHDEIESFLNARYLSPPEATWHILQNPMVKNTHAVYRLGVHLPERQRVQFMPGFERQAMERNEVTQLTAWFALNQTDPEANRYLYPEIPLHYVWRNGRWTRRRRGGDKIIARMYNVNFRNQELYCLRLLLLHVRGCRSYDDVRTVDGVVCDTFVRACQIRNLLADDVEWRRALREASLRDMPYQMRNMFAYMLLFCEIGNTMALWEEFREFFIEDFVRRGIDDEPATERALNAIQTVLVTHGQRLSDFGLPEPAGGVDDVRDDPIDVGAERLEGERLRAQLNPEQAAAFDAILNAVNDPNERNRLFFINAAAGTGKSFVFRTLISVLRGENETVMAMAPTGLAASLLKGGRTVHSRFKLPLNINETTTTGVTPNSYDGGLIRAAKLFIIDEISMVTRTILQIIDKGLRDICNDNRPFGNKAVVVGGDFRQILPVVVGGDRAAVVNVSVKSSPSWHSFFQLNLLNNVRANQQQHFAQWLLDLGNGALPFLRRTPYGNLIEIPAGCLVDSTAELQNFCFGDLNGDAIPNAVILSPLNLTCSEINDSIIRTLPGQSKIYVSADSVDAADDPVAQLANYPVEFLNTLMPSGFPTHRLLLKVGAIVILLRNLNVRKGLCNGTRMIVRILGNQYIETEKLDDSGRPSGEIVFIPRIDLISADGTLPFKLRRRQFPVKLAYAMTIHKSQGQTFDRVGIHLPSPVFAHGQLYVAFSRARSFQGVKVFVQDSHVQGKLRADSDQIYTRNIVYPEIL